MKKFLKITSFVLVVVTLYMYAGMVLMPKNLTDSGGEKYYGAISYRYEPENTIDVMFYGNSDVYNGISPMEIYKRTGIASYGCGAAKQTIHAIYFQLKSALKTQKPKAVVIDTDCFYQPNEPFKGTVTYDCAFLIAPFLYHSRWKELKPKDFVTLPTMKGKDNYLKGYAFSGKVKDYKVPDDYMKDLSAKPAPIKKSVLKDFDKIYRLCKRKNIELSLITIPSPSSWNNAKSNGIKELALRYGKKHKGFDVKFFDMNLGIDGFDYSTCFRDNGNHCNYTGAMAVSKAVGDYLTENYLNLMNLPKKPTWDASLKKYEEFIESRKNAENFY